MAASYLRRGMTAPATFSLFARRLPRRRGFLVAAGLSDALAFLEQFRFDDDELAYLRTVVGLDEGALRALGGLRFTGDVWAVPEGRVVGADVPLLEVTAPIAQAQLVETGLLNVLTFATVVATKAARCRIAAGGADLIDFAFRRTHGVDAAMAVARASAIAGFAATSNVEAARRYGLRAAGTMAHSYVQAFGDERAAFRAFALDFPDRPVFLVDTYDTLAGVHHAVEVVDEVRPVGPVGIRLDSGDFDALARASRAILDAAGHSSARIIASGGLDEDSIATLVAGGAPINAYGVGTRWVCPATRRRWTARTSWSTTRAGRCSTVPGKATLPGAKQVYRAASAGCPTSSRCAASPPRRAAAHTRAGDGRRRAAVAGGSRRAGAGRAGTLRSRPGMAARCRPPPRRPAARDRHAERPIGRSARSAHRGPNPSAGAPL
ncbi:nicotinate phosphoribosyltransferase [Luedemannella flava]